jgi:hypothetical protein
VVLAIGFTSFDQRHPGSNVYRPTSPPPTFTIVRPNDLKPVAEEGKLLDREDDCRVTAFVRLLA